MEIQTQTQFNDQNLIQTLIHEIRALRDDVQLLKHDVRALKCQNEMMTKQKFDKNHFLKTPTVSYLSTHNLDRDTMGQLLNMWKNLDFQCAKYLIDCWDNGMYEWDDMFMCKYLDNCEMLIHFVCKYGDERAILYMLDIYAKKGLDVEPKSDSEWLPIHYLCCHGTDGSINRIIDIYIERKLDLECVMSVGWTLLHLLCRHGPEQSIKRMTLLYVERNYNLNKMTLRCVPAIGFVCRNKSMDVIKFMIDIYYRQKLSLGETSVVTLEAHMNANPLLNGNRVMNMYLNSLEMEVFV